MLEERRLSKAKVTLMRNPKFALLSGVLMVGRTSIDEDVPTACTNGRDEKYGRAFVNSLADSELAFVIAHEAGHKMYRHLTTWDKLYKENARLANIACDHVINIMLRDLDPTEQIIRMPRDAKGELIGVCDTKYRGMSTKQVFDLLKKEGEGEGQGGGGSGEGNGHENGGFDEHDWEGAKGLTEEQKKELARDIDQAIRQGQMAAQKIAGGGSGGLSRELVDLMQPKIDWREALREYVKSVCRAKDQSSWRRVNRRFLSTGIYMPSMIGEKMGHLVIGVDTSGSVGGKELSEFLSEVQGIAEEVMPSQVDLLYWDGEVAGHEEYTESDVANIVSSTKPKGGGGTSPSCVSRYLKDKKIEPECVVMLSDGYVGDDWGHEWSCPVLWVIVGGNNVVAPNGKTIHIVD